jgi:protein-S-isoprenylcysteine O-methyltransferase Ste14
LSRNGNRKKKGMAIFTKQIIKAVLFIAVLAALLFGVSGDIFWAGGWLYLGVFSGCSIISTILMVRHNPGLLKERMQPGEGAKPWDRILAPLMAGVCPALIVATAALDVRLGRTGAFSLALVAASVACAIAGHALMTWAMMRNDFFSALVRIQSDRGHLVTTHGPYRFVRHPGYVGMLMFASSTPFILGSWWALVPAALNVFVGALRTALEDRTLHRELDGYADYARAVPCRLLPGIW